MIEPRLSCVAARKRGIERLEAAVEARAKAAPACRHLMSAPGVGVVTALAYGATIDSPERFAKSRTVGACLGLTRRRFQSGDAMLRGLLYEAADSMLTVLRRAHPRKDWARRIKKPSRHRQACVALAYKLAVILHRMPITGEPFRWPEQKRAGKTAGPDFGDNRVPGADKGSAAA